MRTDPLLVWLAIAATIVGLVGLVGMAVRHPDEAGAFAPTAVAVAAVLAAAALCAAP
jgi:hypothetical protein